MLIIRLNVFQTTFIIRCCSSIVDGTWYCSFDVIEIQESKKLCVLRKHKMSNYNLISIAHLWLNFVEWWAKMCMLHDENNRPTKSCLTCLLICFRYCLAKYSFSFPLSPLNTKWDKLALDLSIPCEPEMRIYF